MGAVNPIETFHWSECRERLLGLGKLVLGAKGKCFESEVLSDQGEDASPGEARWRVTPPLVFPLEASLGFEADGSATRAKGPTAKELAQGIRNQAEDSSRSDPGGQLVSYLSSLAKIYDEPPLQCVILMQAGAVSIGMFEYGDCLATKTIKRYVVRGKGRAQPAHLRTKGKSRYGSRLRLQNAKLIFEETNDKLNDYFEEFGTPVHIFSAAPARLWPDLFRAKTQPPFDKHTSVIRIPMDLPVPTTDTLLRTYKTMGFGRIEQV